jgi:N-acetylmuramoyl-L-alanine amidase
VAAEAEDQPFEGKRAVVAVVLNRKDFGKPFEKTIEGVIFQKGQFSCIADKRFFRAHKYVSEEDKKAVREELKQRSDKEILFFTAGKYGRYGTHAYRIGAHFFCKK